MVLNQENYTMKASFRMADIAVALKRTVCVCVCVCVCVKKGGTERLEIKKACCPKVHF